MATAPINRPRVYNAPGTPWPGLARPFQSNGGNTFSASQFVSLTSTILAAYVADGTAIYGLVVDDSHTATSEPYASPYGLNHNCVDPRGQQFIMNITDASGNVGSGSTTLGDVVVGTLYSARYLASVDTAALGVDASDSGTATKNIFKVEDLYLKGTKYPDGDLVTDFNGRVIVSIIATAIQ